MKSNLERFQMTKLSPFKEKLQRQYLGTNVSINRLADDFMFHVSDACIISGIPTAHWALGGNAADRLQQVPHLANSSDDEENLTCVRGSRTRERRNVDR